MKNYIRKILSLFTEGPISAPTAQQFYRWLLNSDNESEKDEVLQELWEEAIVKGANIDVDKSFEQWKQNNGIIPAQSQKPKNKKKRIMWLWQTAAAVLLLVSVSLGYLLNKVERTEADLVQQFIPTAQMRTFLLPDGTQVQMNSNSTLLYPKQFTQKNRSVYLVGEANFKVKPDKKHPFIVKTDDYQVTALGTEFNVSAYPANQEISTTLISGCVLIEYNNLSEKTHLHPNEQLVYNKTSHLCALNHPDMQDATAWQRGELVFRQMTLQEIINVLERKYSYQFVYSRHSLKNERYSFRFKDQAPLAEVMDVIVDVVGNLTFKIHDDKCEIIQE